jgi:raffinose/stachyose/melibiose transport system permease protein
MKWSQSLRIQRMHIGGHVVLIVVAAVILVPLYYVLINAFKTDMGINMVPMGFSREYFTFENFRNVWRLLSFPKALMNSLILVVVSCGILIIAGALAGFSIAIIHNRLLRTIYTTLVLLISVPFQVILIPNIQILSALKLMNNYFGTSFLFAAINMPFTVFLYTGFMRAIPRELCEAAIVDGCGMGKTFLRIYMPLMRVVTSTVLILRGTGVWNDLLIPLATFTNEKYDPLIRRLYAFASLRFNRWDLLFAGTVLCSVPILLLFLFLQRVFIRGMLVGSVKG